MGVCSVCKEETNYKCIACQESICNRSLDCHVPVEEGSIPGWQMGRQVAICHPCKESREESSTGAGGSVDPENLKRFEINCASRGFHVYRSSWKPMIGERLQLEQEYGNVHDPFAISIHASLRDKITASDIVGHIPREISRFCHFFLNYGGALEGRVRDSKFRRSPIPKGGLEIPIVLIVWKDKASTSVFSRMKDFVEEYYIEPDKMTVSAAQSEAEERVADDDLDEYCPEEENATGPVQQNHPTDAGEDNIIVIED